MSGQRVLKLSGVLIVMAWGGGIKGILDVYLVAAAAATAGLVVASWWAAHDLDLEKWWQSSFSALRGEY